MTARRKFDPYTELGVQRDASDDDIKRAFRDRAKVVHPDAGGDNRAAWDRAKRAQVILLDPERRRKFDENGDADEPDINGPDQGALTMLSALLTQILAEENTDPFKHDLIEVMRNALREDAKKELAAFNRIDRSLMRIAKMRGRFRRKLGADNVFESMLAFNENQLRELMASQRVVKSHRDRALAILAEYDFIKDPEQVAQALSRWNDQNGWTAAGSLF